MKQISLIIMFVATFSISNAGNKGLPNLGMISQLLEMKYCSEAYLSDILNDTTKSEADKLAARQNYNAVRIQIDRAIYQLAADMRTKNSVKTYKQLDKHYKKHQFSEMETGETGYKLYVEAFDNAYKTYKERIHPDVAGKEKAFIETEVILAVAELGWTIINDIHDMKGEKVDGVIEILNNLRFNPPSELDAEKEKS
jgi:hypothetical protein